MGHLLEAESRHGIKMHSILLFLTKHEDTQVHGRIHASKLYDFLLSVSVHYWDPFVKAVWQACWPLPPVSDIPAVHIETYYLAGCKRNLFARCDVKEELVVFLGWTSQLGIETSSTMLQILHWDMCRKVRKLSACLLGA